MSSSKQFETCSYASSLAWGMQPLMVEIVQYYACQILNAYTHSENANKKY